MSGLGTAEVTKGAVGWLFRNGYSVAVEIGVGCYRSPRDWRTRKEGGAAGPTCPEAARRLDVVGVGSNGNLAGIEVKVSKQDLLGDKKMHLYRRWVDRFYIAVPAELEEVAYNLARSRDAGLLVVTQREIDGYISAEARLRGKREAVGPGPRADLILAIALRAGDPAFCPSCGGRPSQEPLRREST
jgi:hypothetical protein